MKKLMMLICMMTIICASTTFGYGAVVQEPSVEPAYIGTFVHSESFTEGTGAALIPKVYLKPKTADSFDKVVIRLQIVKTSTGTEYYDKSFTTYYDSTRRWFMKTVTFTAPSKGTYRLNTTYKCYKDGDLIETIKGVAKTATY